MSPSIDVPLDGAIDELRSPSRFGRMIRNLSEWRTKEALWSPNRFGRREFLPVAKRSPNRFEAKRDLDVFRAQEDVDLIRIGRTRKPSILTTHEHEVVLIQVREIRNVTRLRAKECFVSTLDGTMRGLPQRLATSRYAYIPNDIAVAEHG